MPQGDDTESSLVRYSALLRESWLSFQVCNNAQHIYGTWSSSHRTGNAQVVQVNSREAIGILHKEYSHRVSRGTTIQSYAAPSPPSRHGVWTPRSWCRRKRTSPCPNVADVSMRFADFWVRTMSFSSLSTPMPQGRAISGSMQPAGALTLPGASLGPMYLLRACMMPQSSIFLASLREDAA